MSRPCDLTFKQEGAEMLLNHTPPPPPLHSASVLRWRGGGLPRNTEARVGGGGGPNVIRRGEVGGGGAAGSPQGRRGVAVASYPNIIPSNVYNTQPWGGGCSAQ